MQRDRTWQPATDVGCPGREIRVIADDRKPSGDNRVYLASSARDPRGKGTAERVAEHAESFEPDRLDDCHQIVGRVAGP
jgi:hypothetical protein